MTTSPVFPLRITANKLKQAKCEPACKVPAQAESDRVSGEASEAAETQMFPSGADDSNRTNTNREATRTKTMVSAGNLLGGHRHDAHNLLLRDNSLSFNSSFMHHFKI